MIRICLGALCALVLLASSCNGGGGADPDITGRLAGTFSIVGPTPGLPLKLGLASSANDEVVASIAAGPGSTVPFEFSDIVLGDYYLTLFSDAAGPAPLSFYEGETYSFSEADPEYLAQTIQFSFLGGTPATWGTVSGLIKVEGEWPGDPNTLVYLAIYPTAQQNARFLQTFSEEDLNEGWLTFNLEGIAPGSYNLGFFGYNLTTHQENEEPFGLEDDVVTVADSENVTNVVFGADFAGDPGTDPVGGTISGTVGFNAALPAGLLYYIAANTIPPQQGAPPSTFFVDPAAITGGGIDYSLPGLPDGDYSVSIFSYDITTHQATYFGEFGSTVTISAGGEITGVNFDADVAQL